VDDSVGTGQISKRNVTINRLTTQSVHIRCVNAVLANLLCSGHEDTHAYPGYVYMDILL
jgi:hypothetical protein